MKERRIFICQSCGHQESKWLGRCPSCSAWSSLVEEVPPAAHAPQQRHKAKHTALVSSKILPLNQVTTEHTTRLATNIAEFDRVLGGGLVPGSLILVGGDPGIGKSTLILQTFGKLAAQQIKTLYVTAEESLSQIKLRAKRLEISTDLVYLLAETRLELVSAAVEVVKPTVLVIDSIQTIGSDELESSIGSVGQIRAVTQKLMEISKIDGVTVLIIGHVTKEGAIAGPKVMEHMVDTVLYFEGERSSPYRILRTHKNRFGSTHEIGVFQMQTSGLEPVSNPSEVFLSQRSNAPGATVITSLEGSRPLLLEVQALTTISPYGNPRRTSIGFDPNRVAMLSAVLSTRVGLEMSGLDVYVNIVGGVKITEPAADLGVVLALASSLQNITIPKDMLIIGEVGLSGEIRSVPELHLRLQEALALGFKSCLVPAIDLARLRSSKNLPLHKLELLGLSHVKEALKATRLLEPRVDSRGAPRNRAPQGEYPS